MLFKVAVLFSTFLRLRVSAAPSSAAATACAQLNATLTSPAVVSFPGSATYDQDNKHNSGSSSQNSACSVRPATVSDVQTIIKTVAKTKSPFGIKSGGHNYNQGFSSTPGVQIALSLLDEISYNASASTVEIGPGLKWEDLYEELEPFGVTVVGGRVPGVGVGGFILGGGFSWFSNQRGLAMDNVVSYEVVLPSGKVVTASASVNSDLFFGLKGGFNNFGIVTKFVLKTHKQGKVWGGAIGYNASQVEAVKNATDKWIAKSKDPKAGLGTFFFNILGTPSVNVTIFYDGPAPPRGLFDELLAIPNVYSTVGTYPYTGLIKALTSDYSAPRSGLQTVGVAKYTPKIIDAMVNQSTFWGTRIAERSGVACAIVAEPFLDSAYAKSQGGLYEHKKPAHPTGINFIWVDPAQDAYFHKLINDIADAIERVAVSEGQPVGGSKQNKYPNYADSNTPLSELYGSNVARGKLIKAKYDPADVMDLAGGFKL